MCENGYSFSVSQHIGTCTVQQRCALLTGFGAGQGHPTPEQSVNALQPLGLSSQAELLGSPTTLQLTSPPAFTGYNFHSPQAPFSNDFLQLPTGTGSYIVTTGNFPPPSGDYPQNAHHFLQNVGYLPQNAGQFPQHAAGHFPQNTGHFLHATAPGNFMQHPMMSSLYAPSSFPTTNYPDVTQNVTQLQTGPMPLTITPANYNATSLMPPTPIDTSSPSRLLLNQALISGGPVPDNSITTPDSVNKGGGKTSESRRRARRPQANL